MTLWIQPLFGDSIEIPFSPPILHWRVVYHYLHHRHFRDKRVDQLRLFRGESADLSGVEEGDILHLFVTDLMAERWVSEYSTSSDSCTYHYSTLTWFNAKWGDPYQDRRIHYRTPLMVEIIVREQENVRTDFMVRNMAIMNPSIPDRIWYPTLNEACNAFQREMNEGEEVCTDATIQHVAHLWMLYHGTNQHLMDQGRYYE